jgi:hypothetical protein
MMLDAFSSVIVWKRWNSDSTIDYTLVDIAYILGWLQ